jgi:hypothetical protein
VDGRRIVTAPPVVPPHQLDPTEHPAADPMFAEQSIFGTNLPPMGPITTPGMGSIQLPQGMGAPRPDPTSLPPGTPESTQLDTEATDSPDDKKKALKAIYGDNFPLALDHQPTDADWSRWIEDRWTIHQPGVQHNIWMAERNRQFRAGFQWQSRINSMGAWRETPIPKDSVRIVDNRIRPALAWAMQVVAEQRPGWQFKPTNTDADRERKADAQQRAVEYQYDAQKKRLIDRETVYWAQTDGVAFQMTYWDPDLGPWEELESGKGPVPLGDVNTRVFRIENVRVSSEATSTISPMYWLVRDILPLQYAVSLYGPDVADQQDQALLAQNASQFSTTNQYAFHPLYQNQRTVARYFVFCDKRDWLPQGMTALIVGKKLVYGPVGLLMGRVPMVRVTDGSEDPSFFPLPVMNLVVPSQMRVNMLWSKWYESIRKNSGGRFASKTNAVSSETFIGGETSILEVRTSGDIRESLMPVQGFSVGNDIKEALDREIKNIEDITGYSDKARGQFESDQSGRAILAERESLERVFSPQVGALAESNTEWAKQMVGWMRFGYQMPRKIAVTGQDRSDLAMELTAANLDGVVDVTVDPSTMIPQPMALKQWMLDNAYDRQLITKDQWLERSQFGDVRDMQAPNEIQYQKAKRVSEQIRLGQPQEPVVWQDDESIHQNVLDRDLILAGGIDPQAQQVAQQRWQQLAQQAAQKQAPAPPQPGTPEAMFAQFMGDIMNLAKSKAEQMIAQVVEGQMFMPQAPVPGVPQIGPGGRVPDQQHAHAPPQGQPLDPRVAPLAGGNPSVAAAPAAAHGGPGVSDQERAAAQFESRSIL